MSIDPIAFFNRPFPGDPDPQTFRAIIVLLVMIVAAFWTKDVISRWTRDWYDDFPIRRNAIWLTGVLVTNGILLLTAAQRDDPIRLGTALLGVVFAGLASSLTLLARYNKPLIFRRR